MSGALSLASKPRLSAKAKLRLDPKSGKTMLLYPEKGLVLNATGTAIVKLCKGEHSLSDIILQLAEQFGTGPERLEPEVLAFVQSLLDRGLLQAEP
jgi:pyrroloquinoline quinone biosynthesis protein D